MRNLALLCTNNILPAGILNAVLDRLCPQIQGQADMELIVVSHFPIMEGAERVELEDPEEYVPDRFDDVILKDFRYDFSQYYIPVRNLYCGRIKSSIFNLFKQMLAGINASDAENIFFTEHDVLYPDAYFSEMNRALETHSIACWRNVKILNWFGYINISKTNLALSRFVMKAEIARDIFEGRLARKACVWVEPILLGAEYSMGGDISEETIYEDFVFLDDGDVVLDIKHGLNSCGMILGEHEDEDSVWGKKEQYIDLIDESYIEFLKKHQTYCYGIVCL